jgi:hypothetical protein
MISAASFLTQVLAKGWMIEWMHRYYNPMTVHQKTVCARTV